LLGSEIQLKCGCTVPVIADACQSTTDADNLPVSEGSVNGVKATVLRDTGCSTVVIRRSLVKSEQLTGTEQKCILIDGTIRWTPVAKVDINTPYFKGQVTAVCMREPLYDIILGNIPGASDVVNPTSAKEITSIVTEPARVAVKQQAKQQPPKQNTVLVMDDMDRLTTREELVHQQKSDKTIATVDEGRRHDRTSQQEKILLWPNTVQKTTGKKIFENKTGMGEDVGGPKTDPKGVQVLGSMILGSAGQGQIFKRNRPGITCEPASYWWKEDIKKGHLRRWALRLNGVGLHCEQTTIKGSKNVGADFSSRHGDKAE